MAGDDSPSYSQGCGHCTVQVPIQGEITGESRERGRREEKWIREEGRRREGKTGKEGRRRKEGGEDG